MDGAAMERDLMLVLRGHQFVPLRAPGSGTGDWDQPDVLAARDGALMAVELKSGRRPSNVQEPEVAALGRFADAFWAASFIAARYSGDRTFYLARPDDVDRTPSGHYSVPGDAENLAWTVALPYVDADGAIDADLVPDRCADFRVVPRFDRGGPVPGVITADGVDQVPSLPDLLDAIAADQQGFAVRPAIFSGGDDGHGHGDGAEGPGR